MKSFRLLLTRGIASVAIAASLVALSAPVLSQPHADGTAAHDPAVRQERMQSHLERMAQRLQINASQQDAWNTYSNTVKSLFANPPARPAADADAATLLRARAQMAANHAQRLTQLADATAQLQQALTPEQRKTLDDMVRRQGHRHRHGHGKHS